MLLNNAGENRTTVGNAASAAAWSEDPKKAL